MYRHLIVALALLASIASARHADAQTGLPRLVSDAALHDYLTKYVVVSDAQAAQIARLHAEYKEKWATEFNAETLELKSKWNSTYTTFENFSGASMAEAYKDVLVLVEKLRARRKVANDLFFDSIEMILAEEQLPAMQRVRNAHDRLSYHNAPTQGLREQEVDVIALVEALTLAPEERAALEAVLRDFEPSYVAAMRDAVDFNLRREQLIFGAIEMVRQNSLHPNNNDGGEEARMREGDRLGNEADRIAFASQRRLVEANRRGLRLFVAAITPESAEALVRRYQEEAYPEIVPDPVLADEVYEQALVAIGDKDPDRLAALQASKDGYDRDHQQLTRKMVEATYAISSWPFELAVKSKDSDYGAQHREAVAAMRSKSEERLRTLGLDREKLNLSQPARVRALLLPEEAAALPVLTFPQCLYQFLC